MGDWLSILALVDEEELRKAREAYALAHPEVPPLHVMPQTNPVAALKNQTALQNKLTPEAATELYNTSVRYNFRDAVPSDTELAHYTPSTGNPDFGTVVSEGIGRAKAALGFAPKPEITLTAQEPWTPQPEVLMHEFAHKRQNLDMPLDRLKDWQHNWPAVVDNWTNERVGERPLGPSDSPSRGFEAYAHQAEHGPMGMPAEMRGYYYPGLFREGLGEPPKPPEVNLAVAPSAPNHNWTPEGAIASSKQPGPWPWPYKPQPAPYAQWPTLDYLSFINDVRGG